MSVSDFEAARTWAQSYIEHPAFVVGQECDDAARFLMLLLTEVDRLKARVADVEGERDDAFIEDEMFEKMRIRAEEAEAELEQVKAELTAKQKARDEYHESWLKIGEELVHWQRRAVEQDRSLAAERKRAETLLNRNAVLERQWEESDTYKAIRDALDRQTAAEERASLTWKAARGVVYEVRSLVHPTLDFHSDCCERTCNEILKRMMALRPAAPDPTPEQAQAPSDGTVGVPTAGSEQPDLPLGHEFVGGDCDACMGNPNIEWACHVEGLDGFCCGQPEAAHRRKP